MEMKGKEERSMPRKQQEAFLACTARLERNLSIIK
jgi:hypothetical protein